MVLVVSTFGRPTAHGHEFTPENTYIRPAGTWKCRACMRRMAAEERSIYRLRTPQSDRCKNGHDLTDEENIYVSPRACGAAVLAVEKRGKKADQDVRECDCAVPEDAGRSVPATAVLRWPNTSERPVDRQNL